MANIITTLHPEGNKNDNLYPNIKKENIPIKSIDRKKLDDGVNSLLNSINDLHPSGTATSTTILGFTSNKGIYVGSDTGNWYYWNGTQYTSGGTYLASPNSVNENRFAIQDIDNVIFYNKNDLTTQNKVINVNLVINDNPNYAISDVIHLYNNYKIKGNTSIDSGVCCLFECKSDGTPIKILRQSPTTQTSFDFEYLASSEMYVKLCLKNNGYARVFNDVPNSILTINNDLEQLTEKVIDIYNLYNLTVKKDKSYWINVPIKNGVKYKVTNNTSATLALGTYSQNKTTEIQSLGSASANSSYIFTANADAYYLLAYAQADGSIIVEQLGTVIDNINNEISDINNSLGYQLDKNKYRFGLNLYNYRTRSEKGYWCNYLNGVIQSNQYVTEYSYSEYIEVEPNTQYTRTTGDRGTCFFNKDKVFISGTQNNTFTTPSNCKYVIMNADYDTAYYWQLVKGSSLPNTYQPYFLDLKYKSPYGDLLMIGKGTSYPTIKEGFEYAVANNLGVIITPDTYDLVSEGITGIGYICPRIVYGYGVTLVCNLSEENWTLSPLNINTKVIQSNTTEIYGLTIICNNCRYCIHDEMGNISKYYHNVYKDLTLINNGVISSTLIKPQCIGGGIGSKGGYIEITNCITESNCPDDIAYHSQFDGNQTGNCTIIIKDCDIKNTVLVANIGSSTSFMNVLRITNCLCGTLPTNVTYSNIKLISWNNVVRS